MKKVYFIIITTSLFTLGIVCFKPFENTVNVDIQLSDQQEGSVEFTLVNNEEELFYLDKGFRYPIFITETKVNGQWREERPMQVKWHYKSRIVKGKSLKVSLDNYGNQEEWRIKMLVYKKRNHPAWFVKVAAFFKVDLEKQKGYYVYSPVVTVDSLVEG